MLERKRNIIIILSILCLLIILPPLIYGYVYPSGGDDTAEHIKIMEQMTLTHPIPPHYLYAGQLIVGYPLMLLKTVFHIPLTTSFMWFNYLALIGVVLSLYFVFSKMFNKLAGLMAAVGIFALQTFVQQYLSGLIFNIISIGIIFPWLLYFALKAWTKRSWKYGIVAVAFIFLFANFHASGVYLPVTPESISVIIQGIKNTATSFGSNMDSGQILQYGIVVLGFVIILALLIYFRKRIFAGITREAKYMMIALGIMSFVLLFVSMPMFRISNYPARQMTDAITFIFLLVMGGLSLFISKYSKLAINSALIAVIFVVAVLWLPMWFSYTSAIKPVDKVVIAYINTLEGGQFCANSNVAPWIYERYVNKKYNHAGTIYVYRSMPMTMRTDRSTEWFDNKQGIETPPDNIVKTTNFYCNGIKIIVMQSGD